MAGNRIFSRCIYCNNTFTSKLALDDHIVKKHPDFITAVSKKVHECTKCPYKTVITSHLKEHTLAKHPDITGTRVTSTCIYCNKTFVRKQTLDDHIVKSHPDFISSVSRKVHECTKCTYKTAITSYLKEHIMIGDNRVTSTCIYCDKTFVRKETLDEHILKTHPDFIASVSRKVHECTECTFKTISNSQFRRHMVTHSAGSRKRRIPRCIHCNKTFASKQALDGHIIRRHPDFIASVSAKVHECTKCTYKTVNIAHLKRHIKKHPDIAGNRVTITCIYCNKTFIRKDSLEDHIVKRHPDFIASVSRKVHECTECTFKTISNSQFRRHMVTHSEHRIPRCIHCNKTFASKQALDGHIIRKHPEFIASVSAKVHECTKSGNRVTSTCIYCNKTFVRKETLNDHIVKSHPDFIASVSKKVHECTKCSFKTISAKTLEDHVVKIHPDFIASVSKKVHECTKCTFKTISTSNLKKHVLAKHPDIAEISRCIYCHKTFVRKEALDDHVVKRHPDFIASVSRKVHECTKCTFKTISSNNLKEHILAGNRTTKRCIYCNKTFLRKQTLDDHMLKAHPDFLASVGKKVHECTKCTYKTVSITNLKKHMVNHPDTPRNRTISTCIYCNKIFVRKETLDDHIVRTHPDFITSVSRKVLECTKCSFKTINTNKLKEHILAKHPDIAGNRVTSTCIYCNKTFVRKATRDDHIVKTHPDFIASVRRKVHECTRCTYKTVITNHLKQHMMINHPDIAGSRITNRCIYCYKTFIREQTLDDHIVKRHPDFIASVSRKVHQCTKCTYKTVIINHLKEHMMTNHPDIAGNRLTNRCIYCNKIFVRKRTLDDHIVKRHPDFITSVSRKVHECTKCTYRTVSINHLKEHITVNHPDIGDNRITNRCIYCSKTFLRKHTLDDHIVRIHPAFIASVSRTVHECTKCTFKTIRPSQWRRHMLTHSDNVQSQ
nr:unnamed protein product [Callosobruchus analis]